LAVDITSMRKKGTTKTLLVIAMTVAVVASTAVAALAQPDKSNGVVHLDEQFVGWFSNGMVNDSEACGPFTASADAVVWHLYLDLPDSVSPDDITKAEVAFGGSVAAEVDWAVADGRIDIWARTTVKDAGQSGYARQGAHTGIRDAQVHLADEDVRLGKDVVIQLGRVCYSDLGPIGEITFYLQALICDGYDRFEGNQVTDSSGHWDQTGGDWQLWAKYYVGRAPKVKVAGKTKGCTFDGNQRFAVGTSAQMANRYVLPGTTDAADLGLIKLSSRDLPEVHQQALLWANEELWFERLDNQALGAFQCYDDRLHADNYEWLLIEDYDKLPSTITCIAWNVTPAEAAQK